MSDVTTYDNSTIEREACADRILREQFAYIRHWLVEIYAYCIAFACLTQLLWNETCRVVIHFLNPDTILIDLTFDVTVSGAAYTQTDRAASTVTWKTNHTDVVCHIFATELCTKTDLVCLLEQLLLKFDVAESTTCLVTSRRECVVVVSRCQFNCKQVFLCASATNHKRDVVWRTSCSTEALHLFYKEWNEGARILDACFGLLVEICLIGRTTTFGYTEEVILHTFSSFQVNLCGEVTFSVHFVIHIERSVL